MKRFFVFTAILAAAVTIGACGGDGTPTADAGDAGDATEVVYPLDDVIHMNQIQVIGTHNSYHISSLTDGKANELNYTHPPILDQLETYGVRQLELDIWETEENVFNCIHLAFLDEGSHCRDIRDCLKTVRDWSDAHPWHVPIILVIEVKQAYGVDYSDVEGLIASGFYDRLHALFTDALGADRIITPDSVRGDYETLRQALAERGWPTLGESRGKFLLVFNCTSERIGLKDAYVQKYPGMKGALFFAKDGQEEGYGAVVELNRATRDAEAIATSLTENYLVRGAADGIGWDDSTIAELAPATFPSGVHWVNTDFLIPQPGRGDYTFEWPGEYPVRCNPVTAPTGCEDRYLEPEAPAFPTAAE